MVLVLLYILYYYCSSTKCNLLPMRRTYFRLWRQFRSRDWRHFWSGPLPVISLPVTWLPVALHCSLANATLSVLIYYWRCMILGTIPTSTAKVWLGLWCWTPLSTIFQLYRDGRFIGRGNRSTGENHRPQVTGKLYHIMLYPVHLAMNVIWTHNFSCDGHCLQ